MKTFTKKIKIHKRMHHFIPIHIKIVSIIIFFILILKFNCAFIQRKIDQYGINSTREEILEDFHPGDVNELNKYIKKFNLEKNTSPKNLILKKEKNLYNGKIHPARTSLIKIEKLNKWKMNDKKQNIIYEKYIFPSAYQYNAKQNNAIFYVLRKSKIQNNKVIIWVPGSGVSNFAFRFIKDFFKIELNLNYNIFVYIPAYHLERTEIGKESSKGFITASPLQNVKNIVSAVTELRILVTYLNKQKVKSISGWGGSMGVPMLLLTETLEPQFEHLTLMIPVFDWNTIFTNHANMKNIMQKYNQKGFTKDVLKRAYNLISPMNYSLKTNAQQVQILYAKYDQLNPVKTIFKYTKKNNIPQHNIIGYNKSHATILLDSQIYLDNQKFLEILIKE